MKFPYRKFQVIETAPYQTKKSLLRPIIPLYICKNNHRVQFSALIDSGADCNVFPAELAKLLDIDLDQGEPWKIHGVSGDEIIVYFHQVDLIIGGIEMKTIVGFGSNLNEDQGILGQNGFFDHFSVKLTLQKEQIEIKQ